MKFTTGTVIILSVLAWVLLGRKGVSAAPAPGAAAPTPTLTAPPPVNISQVATQLEVAHAADTPGTYSSIQVAPGVYYSTSIVEAAAISGLSVADWIRVYSGQAG